MNTRQHGLRIISFILFTLSFVGVGCSSITTKQNAAVSKAVYAERDALKSGRIDLAEKFNEQVTRLIPPPKKSIAVKPVIIQGKLTVILPAELNGYPVTSTGSPAFTAAVSSDKALQGQLRGEGKALGKLTSQTDGIVQAKEKVVEKAEKPKGFISKLFGLFKWGSIIGIPLLIIGGILLVVFVPASIPFITAFLGLASKMFNFAISNLEKLIQFLESKVPK